MSRCQTRHLQLCRLAMSGALAWAVADPSNGGHSGFAQGHHRHRRSRRPSSACTGGGCRSGCPRISLGASWRQAAAYLTTFECDLDVLRGSRCRFAKSEAIGGGGRGELGGATSPPPPRWAETSRLCSAGPSGRSGVQKVLAGTTSAAPDPSPRVILASPKVVIVTGGLEGHDPLPQVEGGGQDALGSVCARSRGGRY